MPGGVFNSIALRRPAKPPSALPEESIQLNQWLSALNRRANQRTRPAFKNYISSRKKSVEKLIRRQILNRLS